MLVLSRILGNLALFCFFLLFFYYYLGGNAEDKAKVEMEYKYAIKKEQLKYSLKRVVQYREKQKARRDPASINTAGPLFASRIVEKSVVLLPYNLRIPSEIFYKLELTASDKAILSALQLQDDWDQKLAAILISKGSMSSYDVAKYVSGLTLEMANHPSNALESIHRALNRLSGDALAFARVECILVAHMLPIPKEEVSKMVQEELLSSRSEEEDTDEGNTADVKQLFSLYMQTSNAPPEEVLMFLGDILRSQKRMVSKVGLVEMYQGAFPEMGEELLQKLEAEDEHLYNIIRNK
ncbi:MAG: hypothetical protein HQK50_02840 [Oligoflexia bacterium]|nr:hypothetical protein [Oligoflexia bacterium]